MRAGSSYVATAVALGVIALTGCTTNRGSDDHGPAPGEDWGDENKFPEIGGAFHSLDALTGTCTFVSGVVTVTSSAAQTIIIGKRADSTILVNGAECRTVATPTLPATAANATTMKRLVVNSTAGQTYNESLILDFLGGFFAPGVATATSGAVAVDLGGGTDALNIRGTSAADTLFVGSDGIAFNADNYKDITISNTETVNIALAGGNDALTATNATATKGITGNAALPLTIFGGSGNDVIVGGAGIDNVYGGPGNDTLSGGSADDFLYGEEGADILQGTATADGSDTINCGDESPTNTSIDVVSYDKRTNVISATMAGGSAVVYPLADGGDAGGGGGADAGAACSGDAGDSGICSGNYGTAGESGEVDLIHLNCEGVTGGSGNDVLVGNSADNVLTGGAGDDSLTGGDGNDTLNGGDGNDSFIEGSTSNGGDVFNGGAGTDTLDYSLRTGDLTVTMDGSAANDGLDNETDNVKADIENILCGSGSDEVTGNAADNKITGGSGADTLNGGAGADTFLEGAAANGGDTFVGGAGIDTVDYSLRTVALTIDMGDDTATDGDGAATEHDNIKDDVENLIAGSGNDTITGNDLNNSIEGGLGNDAIDGGDGDDQLDGTDNGGSVDNDLTCGAGTDLAINKGGAGSYAVDCELTGN
jgi:Ca2+-binding RTX toxin-like protein